MFSHLACLFLMMQMAVVEVIDVTIVLNGFVAAVGAVNMIVAGA